MTGMSNEIDSLKKAYPPFENQLDFEDFVTRVNSLANKWDFVRGSLLYQQSLKCKDCDPNIAIVLLCSCADAMKVAGENAGSRRNFKEFYLKYCPTNMRDSPIEYYPDGKLPIQKAPFEKTLDFIYSKLRCLQVHEGKGRLEVLSPSIKWVAGTLLDVYESDCYCVDTLRIFEWFAKITQESLFQVLKSRTI